MTSVSTNVVVVGDDVGCLVLESRILERCSEQKSMVPFPLTLSTYSQTFLSKLVWLPFNPFGMVASPQTRLVTSCFEECFNKSGWIFIRHFVSMTKISYSAGCMLIFIKQICRFCWEFFVFFFWCRTETTVYPTIPWMRMKDKITGRGRRDWDIFDIMVMLFRIGCFTATFRRDS